MHLAFNLNSMNDKVLHLIHDAKAWQNGLKQLHACFKASCQKAVHSQIALCNSMQLVP